MINQELWNRCVEFHGHTCAGIAIGFRAAYFGLELILDEIEQSETDKICCEMNSNKCPADGVRFLIGATEENGKLKTVLPLSETEPLHFKFYVPDENNGYKACVEFYVKDKPQHIKGNESVVYYLMNPENNIFEII